MRKLVLLSALLLCATFASAQQRFFNLTTEQVQVDSIVPHIGWTINLPANYQDSVYTASLLYPEYIDMAPSDVAKYEKACSEPMPSVPTVNYTIGYDRKQPRLIMDVCPFVCIDGKYKILAGYMLKVEAEAVSNAKGAKKAPAKVTYADHSVLASGTWAKIRVSETGIYQLTESVIKNAGFKDINKVKIYGYGGNLQNEKLVASELTETDDLKEVPQCIVGGRHLFFAKGPVSYSATQSKTGVTHDVKRIRNPYSNYGYYFITENDDPQTTVSEEEFKTNVCPSNNDFHALYENDGYAWFSGGRKLYDPTTIGTGSSKTYTLKNATGATNGKMYISISSQSASTVQVECNGKGVSTLKINASGAESYDVAKETASTITLDNLTEENNIKLLVASGGPVRLDYIALTYPQAAPQPSLDSSFPAAEYVYRITNQDHHADANVDMVILIPTSQKVLPQAKRLKEFHEQHDGMTVRIVPADELYNEFSSGTPDANAYRRYMKMMYDRAESETEMPKYLLLMGDCLWDNRMLTPVAQSLSPDDYLLCFESENSTNHVSSYVDDCWFCLLDEGEGVDPQKSDLLDICVGRFPVTTEASAKIMVDKTINYVENKNAGAWQNTIMFMGDDGNNNIHMEDADNGAKQVDELYPGYLVKRVMWDVYERQTSATGNTYPAVTKIIKQQQAAGALIMDYAGHGSEIQISHEAALRINDFASFNNANLPLWITASCDIMPFDSPDENIGEVAVLNSKGGAVAFYGTTRTVYQNYNERINKAFVRYALSKDSNGKPTTLGEAQRQAKNYLIKSGEDITTNKLQFSLLGDPALALNLPNTEVVIDEINDMPLTGDELPMLKAGSVAKVKGHVVSNEPFNGTACITVRDTEEHLVCRLNNKGKDGAEKPYEYNDRTKTLFTGSDTVKNGEFTITFAVPMDINYANGKGLMTLYAYSDDKTITAHGCTDSFLVGGSYDSNGDEKGPSIYCYLNSPSFINGGDVNPTPYFVAQMNDENGLNTTGNGIGHDLQLIVDGDIAKTYILNDNFTYDFGSYTSGSTYYSLPTLEPGRHTLQFRAWDVFNNSSTAVLDFNVVKSLEPKIFSVTCTKNPATTETTFIISHDRTESNVNVVLEVMDASGRLLWKRMENGIAMNGNYTIDWDLTVDGGNSLQTGVYLYRCSIASDGSEYTSKAKKLIIIK